MDILSKIQSILSTEPLVAKKPSFLFLLDLFYTIVILRSGYASIMQIGSERQSDMRLLRQQQLYIFPEALYQLMTLDAWNDCEARVGIASSILLWKPY